MSKNNFKNFFKKQNINNELLGYLDRSEREKLIKFLNIHGLTHNYKLTVKKQPVPLLSYAVVVGCGTIIKDLINLGADVNANNDQALSMAIETAQGVVARILLKAGANPNADNGALLKTAALKNNLGLLEEMYNYGAKFTEKLGKELFAIAYRNNNYDMQRFISERIVKPIKITNSETDK